MLEVSSMKAEVLFLKKANSILKTRLDLLEMYNRRKKKIITGLPVASFAKAAATSNQS